MDETAENQNLPAPQNAAALRGLLTLLSRSEPVREGVFESLIRQNSKATRKPYLGCLKEFSGWLSQHELFLEDLRAMHVEAYKHYLLDRPKRFTDSEKTTPATARQQLSAIKSLLSFLEVRGHLDRNAAASVRHPRTPTARAAARRRSSPRRSCRAFSASSKNLERI